MRSFIHSPFPSVCFALVLFHIISFRFFFSFFPNEYESKSFIENVASLFGLVRHPITKILKMMHVRFYHNAVTVAALTQYSFCYFVLLLAVVYVSFFSHSLSLSLDEVQFPVADGAQQTCTNEWKRTFHCRRKLKCHRKYNIDYM